MNILKTIKNIPSIVTRGSGRTMLQLKKYSPEILLGVGIVGGVTATVMACRATSKLPEIMDEHEEATTNIAMNENAILSASAANDWRGVEDDALHELKKEKTKIYLHTTVNVVKVYAPAVGFGAASIACILGSFGILKGRNAALMAAYSVLNDRFVAYRQRVRDDLGEEADKKYLYGTHKEIIEVEEIGKNGKVKKVKKEIEVAHPDDLSPYCKCFDETCVNWDKDPDYNKLFLTRQQNWANDKLKAQGHIFLNEVYDMLGFPRTKAGQVIGWVYDPEYGEGDGYVDFGLFNIHNECSRDFVNGYESRIWLDFNVDGVIYDKI